MRKRDRGASRLPPCVKCALVSEGIRFASLCCTTLSCPWMALVPQLYTIHSQCLAHRFMDHNSVFIQYACFHLLPGSSKDPVTGRTTVEVDECRAVQL